MTVPKPGWVTEVDYIRPIDGDTIEVEIRRRFHVRLKDIDVYERRTEKGIKATEFVDEKLINANRIIVEIPTNNVIKLLDINSFERLMANIYVDNDNLADLLRQKGFEKPK
jgi:endonuclease YncB( thermonuclease family)